MSETAIWMAVLSASFGLWAAVVGWAAAQFIKRIDRAVDDLRRLDDSLQHWIHVTEKRLTRLETLAEAQAPNI